MAHGDACNYCIEHYLSLFLSSAVEKLFIYSRISEILFQQKQLAVTESSHCQRIYCLLEQATHGNLIEAVG